MIQCSKVNIRLNVTDLKPPLPRTEMIQAIFQAPLVLSPSPPQM